MADTPFDAAADAEKAKHLDKPGAGVPALQGVLLRWLVGPVIARFSNWDKNAESFSHVNAKIMQIVGNMNDAQLATHVLVPPQRGLEDSSRYWSAGMTLEHLLTVGTGVKHIIVSLSKGIVPDIKPDPARVKPKEAMAARESLQAYRQFIATAIDDIERAVKDRKSKAVLAHPWFGPFTAHQWHWLLTAHSAIHLHQLRAISARLQPAAVPQK